LIKIRPGQVPAGSSELALSLARGECEGAQVVVKPPAAEVFARASPLSRDGRSLQTKLYRVEYVEVKTPSNGQGAAGLWPDPLLPISESSDASRRPLKYESTAERPLVFYVELCAPNDAAPGSYRGALQLTAADQAPLAMPIRALVEPFELPATSSLPNSFGHSLYSIAKGHKVDPASDEARALLRQYATSLLAHRLSAYGMGMDPPRVRFVGGRAELDFSDYDREMAPFLEGTVLPSGARFTSTDVRDSKAAKTDEEKVAYYRAFREHFEKKGWKTQLFFYAKDEPKPEELQLVRTQAKRVREASNIPVLVTSPLDSALEGAADILTPTLNCFFPRKGPETCKNVQPTQALRRALPSKAKVWWYQSCNSHGCNMGPSKDKAVEEVYSGWASYMVDHPAPLNRAMGTLAFIAGVDGELYFDTVYAYNTKDPWKDLFEFGGNGDGTLFYPGTPDRVGGHLPIESLRLKAIRDGLEDYEYLRLAEKLGAADFAKAQAAKLARSGYEVTQDPKSWISVREALAARLRALWNGSEYRKGRAVTR
jgi:hypothetical protein